MLAWPAWHLDAYAAFLEREPHPLERIEIVLARIAARAFSYTRAPDSPAVDATHFLLPADLWRQAPAMPAGAGLTPEELQMIGCLDGQSL